MDIFLYHTSVFVELPTCWLVDNTFVGTPDVWEDPGDGFAGMNFSWNFSFRREFLWIINIYVNFLKI